MATEPPRVFVSHAWEDKDRFVLRFASALRERGVDAWVDQWELLAGDSLIDKIFEEGLKRADAVVIILSHQSVASKWVREELNAAVVARIQKNARIIPVLIDDVEVPEALKSTLWVPAKAPEDFQPAVDKVVNAVFERRVRPPLGAPPGIAEVAAVAGLQASDTLVLRAFGDRTLTMRHVSLIRTDDVGADVAAKGVDRDAYLESLEVLHNRSLLKPTEELSPIPHAFQLTPLGMEEYLRHFFADYSGAVRAVAADLANNHPSDLSEIQSRLPLPEPVLRHLLDRFHEEGLIGIAKALGGFVHIVEVSRQIRRLL